MGEKRTELIHRPLPTVSLGSMIQISCELNEKCPHQFPSGGWWRDWNLQDVEPHWRKGVTAVGRLLQFYIPLRSLSILCFLIHRDLGSLRHMLPCLYLHEGLKSRWQTKTLFPYVTFSQGTWTQQWGKMTIQYNYKLHLHNIWKFKM